MRRLERGIGLVEILVALVLGLVVVLGITQIFVSSKQSFVMQDASARMQEDARYLLTRISQDIRAVGVFGCLPVSMIKSPPPDFSSPVTWKDSALSLVTSRPASGNDKITDATWTVHTNCTNSVTVVTGAKEPEKGFFSIPVDLVTYKFDSKKKAIMIKKGAAGEFQQLISGVRSFDVKFGVSSSSTETYVSQYVGADSVDPAKIRSVRMALVMDGTAAKVKDQTYTVVTALRNRLL
ncbi:PilW family protein [Metapseudomonas otitidis]|uniref:PilW family protein n=1 Tax=Metapseudomonas otitidis TaxID=319939 RepID=UPI0013F5A979|nr:PilW family protein [Pseudomonas otitidis]